MALLDRVIGTQEPKLPVHQFCAALREWSDGAVTRVQVISAFDISVEEAIELDWLRSKYQASLKQDVIASVFEGIMALAERGLLGYDNKATIIARINSIG